MTAAMITVPARTERAPLDLVGELFRREPLFAATGFLLAALMAPTWFAWLVETRTTLDVNVWVKPLKFQASLALYALTLAWFARWLPAGTAGKRWYRVFVWIVVAAIALEMVWLVYAAGIGEPSHFNRTDPFLSRIYFVMGGLAVVLTSATLVYGLQIARNRDSGLSPALKASVVQGLVLTFVLTLLAAGFMSAGSGHAVGGNLSDAEAAPLMGWARDGGDLRVAHFFATHAMQFIPAFGVVSAVAFGREKTWPVNLFTVLFAAFTLYTLAQALSGQPFLPAIG